jgi:hypothetical protein
MYGSDLCRFKVSLQFGGTVLRFALIDSFFILTQPQSLRFAHCRLTWAVYSVYSQLTSIYSILTRKFHLNSALLALSKFRRYAATPIQIETKHIQRLTLLRTENSPRLITLLFTSQECILLQLTLTKVMIFSVPVKQTHCLSLPPSSLFHHLLLISFYALMC